MELSAEQIMEMTAEQYEKYVKKMEREYEWEWLDHRKEAERYR